MAFLGENLAYYIEEERKQMESGERGLDKGVKVFYSLITGKRLYNKQHACFQRVFK
jgi:hypothetical protein